MTNESKPNPGTTTQETPTPSPAPSGPKPKQNGRTKKQASADEKVPLTVSVSPTFLKRLRIVSQGLDESVSDYVESRLTGAVGKDLKRVLEEMG